MKLRLPKILMTEINLTYAESSTSYLREKAVCFHYEEQLVNIAQWNRSC